MLYWECKRRLLLLHRFRVLAVDYFQKTHYQSLDLMTGSGLPPRMNAKAQDARNEINHIMQDAQLSFDLLDIPRTMSYTPVGGYIQRIDVIGNIFDLWQFEIHPQIVFDITDRAIGVYEKECWRLLCQSFNPLYWLVLIIGWVLRLPFKLLGMAGYDATKIEASGLGKAFKLVWVLALGSVRSAT